MTDTNSPAVNPTQLDAVHKFERAGLGKAPFKIVGFSVEKYQACHGAPIQPGGSCDYCGTGIMDTFRIRSADGKVFKVGSDCVRKTGDAGLMKLVDAQVRKINREKRHAREAEQIAEGRTLIADPAVRAKLAAMPHPYAESNGTVNKFFASKTALEFAEWMLSNGGNAGKVRALKAIRKLLG